MSLYTGETFTNARYWVTVDVDGAVAHYVGASDAPPILAKGGIAIGSNNADQQEKVYRRLVENKSFGDFCKWFSDEITMERVMVRSVAGVRWFRPMAEWRTVA